MKKKKFNFGKAFGGSIEGYDKVQVAKREAHFGIRDLNDALLGGGASSRLKTSINPWYLSLLRSAIIIVFGFVLIRLLDLQIVQGDNNRLASDQNRISYEVIHAPRGMIYDRNGIILARNAPGFRLIKGKQVSAISRDTALDLENKGLVYEGREGELGRLEVGLTREYPLKNATAHLLGYTSEITSDEFKDKKYKNNYNLGDQLGRLGLESYYQDLLRGRDGQTLAEVDASGSLLRTIGEKKATPGTNLKLSIDANLNQKIYDTLSAEVQKVGAKAGAAVAMDPRDGRILALTSYPSFDPNVLIAGVDKESIARTLTGEDKPIFSRVISGTYPPGSVFKIATSVAALESGRVKPDTKYVDNGQIFLGEFKFTNWYFTQYGRTEGEVDLVKALRRSNDTYFYQVAQALDEKIIGEYAKKLGLGSLTGIDLPGESSGLVPTNEWKKANVGQIWYPGDTLHMAIGQGFVLVTPLQLANMTSVIASNGTLFRPQIIMAQEDESGKVIKDYPTQKIAEGLVSPQDLAVIKEGMRQACAQGGTGWPMFTFTKATVACKTGTAEFGNLNPHAWFTVFAPVDNPNIVLTVLIEHGGEGSSVAGPVARQVMDWWFNQKH